MNRNALPTEEEQYEEYRKAAVDLEGKPLIIRTLDIGGDKKLAYLPDPPAGEEAAHLVEGLAVGPRDGGGSCSGGCDRA
jgi:phosphoenolpyruvate-protein kinase (PTS system EI component)